MSHEELTRKYSAYVRAASREPPPDDEYAQIAACDALTAAYDLDRYPTPRIPKRRPRADRYVVRGDGVFSFREGGEPPCRA